MNDITLETQENFTEFYDKVLCPKRNNIPTESKHNKTQYDICDNSSSEYSVYWRTNRVQSSRLWNTVFHVRTKYLGIRKRSQTASAMWATSLCVLLLGLASCCVSLPQIQYVNDKPYHLMQSTECRGGKVFEINEVQDIDECKTACLHRNCKAVNLFQVGEFEFKCEILAYVRGYVHAQGAACYVSYY